MPTLKIENFVIRPERMRSESGRQKMIAMTSAATGQAASPARCTGQGRISAEGAGVAAFAGTAAAVETRSETRCVMN
jgi:hypothetical protein